MDVIVVHTLRDDKRPGPVGDDASPVGSRRVTFGLDDDVTRAAPGLRPIRECCEQPLLLLSLFVAFDRLGEQLITLLF